MNATTKLCACGCNQPTTGRSAYAAPSHRARAYNVRNPRVRSAPPEVLFRAAEEHSSITEQWRARLLERELEQLLTKPQDVEVSIEVRRARKPRRPRTPRVHVDVLGEDAEKLRNMAEVLGRTPAEVVRNLIRRAFEEGP